MENGYTQFSSSIFMAGIVLKNIYDGDRGSVSLMLTALNRYDVLRIPHSFIDCIALLQNVHEELIRRYPETVIISLN